MHKGYDLNEHGTMISVHQCDTCGNVFTLCPAVGPGQSDWDNCLAPKCKSYDKDRDADRLFDDPDTVLIECPAPERGQG